MGHRRKNQRRWTGGALSAVLAVIALLIQLMIPAAALAAEAAAARASVAVICTADGAVERAVPAPDHHEGFAGLRCLSCVMASVAAITPSGPTAAPVLYTDKADVDLPGRDRPRALSQAPPRPPSTAPPAFPTA